MPDNSRLIILTSRNECQRYYKQLIITFNYRYRVVKLLELVLGVVLLLGSTYGYLHSSNLIVQVQNYLTAFIPQFFPRVTEGDSSSNFFGINQQAMEKMIKVTQYGFIILAVSGLAILSYGVVAKKQNTSAAKEKFHT